MSAREATKREGSGTPRVHPSSVVDPRARIGEGVVIGPLCHVDAGVSLAERVELVSHVVVMGETRIGPRAKIFPFATIGGPAQDLKSAGFEGRVRVGADCLIREGVTINAGTAAGGGLTSIGDACSLLAYSHVAHDCHLGDRVILSNNVLLGGHIAIGDSAIVGGAAAVHQHVRIGAHAFVAGLSGLEGDAPPFTIAGGNRAHLFGLNLVGLRRRGFSDARIARLADAYRVLFAREPPSPLEERIAAARKLADEDGDIALLTAFLLAPSQRPLCAPRPRRVS